MPILTVLLSRISLLSGGRERLGARRWLGLAVGSAGVAVLAAPQLRGGSAWSVTEVLLTAVGYAGAPLVAARYLRDVPTLPLTAACLCLSAAVYAPAAAATWPSRPPSGEAVAALVALGVVCTAGGFSLFFELIREVGASRAMVFTYVNPAVAVAAGVVILGEPLSATTLTAFALILGGCLLATAGRRRPEPGPVPTGTMGTTADEPAGRSRRGPLRDLAEERPGSTGQGGR